MAIETGSASGPVTTGEGQRTLESFGYKQELSRQISTVDLIVYGLVFMVPIAPWTIFGTVYNSASGMVPLVYLIGLIAMVFTALAYAQMAKSFPLAGSVFAYVGRGIHPGLGFFAGWAMLLDYLLIPTLLYVFAAESMVGLFPGTPRWVWAVVFVAVNTVINLLGVSSLKIVNRLFLAVELVFVVLFIIIAVRAINGQSLPDVRWSTLPIWNTELVTAPLLAAALSIAVLSFLGFDGISTLAEESTGKKNPAGRAMIVSLFIVAFLFITQTWLASLLAGGREAFSDDEAGNAFFTLVQAASSTGWMNAFFVVNVLAVGFANAMAAQAATSRLLFSMSRDRQLPAFLSKISSRKVPVAALLVVSALSLVLVLFFVGQIGLISSLVNFGALFGFCLLHASVIWFYLVRNKSTNYLLHGVVPTIGFLIIGYVLINADSLAKIGGISWLVIGAIVFGVNKVRGRGVPTLTEAA
ncbi:APC family permease [Mycolicibacterium smegmatis]|uniref:APC family permease n=1 Tax=Mycolicibacterium smegmatis TaxID=1772 RepID=UPI0005D9288E|nr:APC family permease [Mycolicibacterium smegmatis]MDF1903485.1 APC family permease [Mycolicibacterium smegmatis]MDF1910012.1 APC family permease [Mycolicibacterium smegmatis]MDF1921880.1 APC family permease [Mycolicibacterium smegmatis]MDF1928376.1 APC family permease [Mycolicibacterium smegmatis]UAK54699.1 APC family permease [Mycolicibacterium smegmatis]